MVVDLEKRKGAPACPQKPAGVTQQEKNVSSHSYNPKLPCEAAVRDIHRMNSKLLAIFSVK